MADPKTYFPGGIVAGKAAGAAADTVADLNQTIGGTPSQGEVQAISDKVDELLAALRAAGVVA